MMDWLIQFSSSEILGRQRNGRGGKVPCRGPTCSHLPESQSESFQFVESFLLPLQVELGRPCPGPILTRFFSHVGSAVELPQKRWRLQPLCLLEKKKEKNRWGSSGRMYNATWITCWLLHSASFSFSSSPPQGPRAHPSGGDLFGFGFPRPELRWCLLVTGLGCQSFSLRESFQRVRALNFLIFSFLFGSLEHAEMSNDILVMIFIACDHEYFFLISEEILLLLYQPPLSALTFLGISSFLELTAGMM